jgi:hypothetical protein
MGFFENTVYWEVLAAAASQATPGMLKIPFTVPWMAWDSSLQFSSLSQAELLWARWGISVDSI